MQHDSRLYVCVSLGQRATSCDRSGRHSRYDPGRSSMVHRRLSACLNTHAYTHTNHRPTAMDSCPGHTALKLPHPWLPYTHTFSVATVISLTTNTLTYTHMSTHSLFTHTQINMSLSFLLVSLFDTRSVGAGSGGGRKLYIHTFRLIWFYVNKHTHTKSV